MPRLSPRQNLLLLANFGREQDDVVSRDQLRCAGFDRDATRRRVDNNSWQQLGTAIVLHSGLIRTAQRQWAAILTAGIPAAVTGLSVAALYGLRGFESPIQQILVPRDRRPSPIPLVDWRTSRRFGPEDLQVTSGIPRVTRARGVIEAAASTESVRRACALLAAAVQQRVATADSIQAELGLTENLKHRRILLAVMSDIAGGADSLSEIDFTKLARRAGLPAPIRQSIRMDIDGLVRFLDVDFGCFSAEVDGGVHLRAQTYWDDAHRQNALVLGGERILRFPSVAIRLDPAGVCEQLRVAYAVFGPPR